jgi:hypothetical protein
MGRQKLQESGEVAATVGKTTKYFIVFVAIACAVIIISNQRIGLHSSYLDLAYEASFLQPRVTQQKLPHWRIMTDCSVFATDCIARAAEIDSPYLPYPFPPKDKQGRWTYENLTEIPREWKTILRTPVPNRAKEVPEMLPPNASPEENQRCLQFTEKSTMEQLDEILANRIKPEAKTSMIAFTISDYNYAHDMIHDVFEMFETRVGFSQKSFFMAAIDNQTRDLACQYNYPVLFWNSDESLKDAVANTKVVLSREIVKRRVSFFFSEMDVWWLQSPFSSMKEFLGSADHQLMFSGHQSGPYRSNIGVYAAKANEKTLEYFDHCIKLLNEKNETHDQYVMVGSHVAVGDFCFCFKI